MQRNLAILIFTLPIYLSIYLPIFLPIICQYLTFNLSLYLPPIYLCSLCFFRDIYVDVRREPEKLGFLFPCPWNKNHVIKFGDRSFDMVSHFAGPSPHM